MHELIDALVDEGSFLEVHKRWAKEVIVGYARLEGRVVGIVANQPKFKGGVLFVDSADKAARFIWTCNAFGIPLLFLADVPGFMIGTAVERQGIIRHGAKMISAVSEATVPKISVIVRKAYGAGLYAMAGPAFDPDATLALPTRQDRRHGAERRRQRGLLQPAAGDRGRAGARRPPRRADGGVRRGRRPAATSRPRWSSTRSCSPRTCATSWCGGSRRYAGKAREWPAKRNAIPPA